MYNTSHALLVAFRATSAVIYSSGDAANFSVQGARTEGGRGLAPHRLALEKNPALSEEKGETGPLKLS